ncbi:MAG: phosphatase PAP2 family protein [Gammaproteobacteria bacterium]|nr:phosphatase PAP2 family protein [Gammaproteobacteria bacterium]MBU1980399.1 phosphatase PAP2 family protein [Gammaproteobacteria bacterium]
MNFLSPAPCRVSWREPRVWLVPLLALASMAVLVASDSNRSLFLVLNGLGTLASDVLWQNLTVLGGTLAGLTLLAPLIGRRPDILWSLALAAIIATLWVHGLKDPIDALRPPAVIPPELLHIIGPAHHYGSFPSGHSTTIFTVAGILSLYLRRSGLVWLVVAAALLVGLSRIAVGVHWPLDVLGGAFGGWLSAMLGTLLAQHWRWGVSRSGKWILGLALAACPLALLISPDTSYPDAIILQRGLALVCLLPVFLLAFGRSRL